MKDSFRRINTSQAIRLYALILSAFQIPVIQQADLNSNHQNCICFHYFS